MYIVPLNTASTIPQPLSPCMETSSHVINNTLLPSKGLTECYSNYCTSAAPRWKHRMLQADGALPVCLSSSCRVTLVIVFPPVRWYVCLSSNSSKCCTWCHLEILGGKRSFEALNQVLRWLFRLQLGDGFILRIHSVKSSEKTLVKGL